MPLEVMLCAPVPSEVQRGNLVNAYVALENGEAGEHGKILHTRIAVRERCTWII